MRTYKIIIITIISILALLFAFIPPVWRLNGGSTEVTQWQRKKGEVKAEVGPAKPGWISVNKVSKHLLYAIIASEDAKFYQHHGLDFEEIWRSLQVNIRKKKYVRGGSTISQQVVKMAFLNRNKNIIRKIREALGALLSEEILTKTEIIEWYINLTEFGDGIYGIKSASKHYFQTKPELLTIQQATHLALVIPSPNGWSVGLRNRDLTDFGHKRFKTIITKMLKSNYITKDQWSTCMATGNFGRPINNFSKNTTNPEDEPYDEEEPYDEDDLNDDEIDATIDELEGHTTDEPNGDDTDQNDPTPKITED